MRSKKSTFLGIYINPLFNLLKNLNQISLYILTFYLILLTPLSSFSQKWVLGKDMNIFSFNILDMVKYKNYIYVSGHTELKNKWRDATIVKLDSNANIIWS